MRRVFNKPKESLLTDVRKRFRYHPQTNQSRPRSIAMNKQNAKQSTKYDGEDFSTVKDKNQFNDSSWLAKLVNGIQETSNDKEKCLENVQIDMDTFGKNQKTASNRKSSLGSIFTIQRKNSSASSTQILKNRNSKKSVPSVTDLRKKSKEKRRASQTSIQQTLQDKSDKMQKSISMGTSKSSQKKINLGKQKIVYPHFNKKNNRVRTLAQKNSLTNYSSIKEEEMCDGNLTQVYKKQGCSQKLQSMQMRIEEPLEEIKRKQSSSKKYSYNYLDEENSSKPEIQKKIYELKNKVASTNKRVYLKDVQYQNNFQEQMSKINEIQSLNEFMFPELIQEELYQDKNVQPSNPQVQGRVGTIKRNKQKRDNLNGLKTQNNKENQPNNTFDNIKVEFTKISPSKRYNYCHEIGNQKNQSVLTIKKKPDSPKKILKTLPDFSDIKPITRQIKDENQDRFYGRDKFQQVFMKINKTRQNVLHRQTLNEQKLSQEERYEYGSIISKIKYLDQKYTLKDFVSECNRIYGSEATFTIDDNRQSYSSKNGKKEQQQLIVPLTRQTINNPARIRSQKMVQNPIKNTYAGYTRSSSNYSTRAAEDRRDLKTSYAQMFRHRTSSEQMNEKTQNYEAPRQKQVRSTKYNSNNQNMAPNKSPYLQMPSMVQVGQKSHGNSSNKDLGWVIQNLNNKLNNYIQFNHLEDTYRKFKLDFVQLKKNMA